MPSSTEPPDTYPKHLLSIPYSPLSSLNTLDIHIPAPLSPSDPQKYWIIYIHGGAFRDPLQTSTTIHPTLPHLLTHPHISALASLNHRLSPYPTHPTHPSSPSSPARSARHPDHVRDVAAGIRWLQAAYGFGARYVLVGHSAGAWLAGWVCGGGGGWEEEGGVVGGEIIKPQAWVGVCGIYDFVELWRAHGEEAGYEEFLTGAFGPDVGGAWGRVGLTTGCGFEGWGGGRLVVLGHGRGDGLVEWGQVVGMERALRGGWVRGGEGRRVEVVEVEGGHMEVVEGGVEVARVIKVALGMLVEGEGEGEGVGRLEERSCC